MYISEFHTENDLEELSFAIEALTVAKLEKSGVKHASMQVQEVERRLKKLSTAVNKAWKKKKYAEVVSKCEEGIALANQYKNMIEEMPIETLRAYDGIGLKNVAKGLAASVVVVLGNHAPGIADVHKSYKAVKNYMNSEYQEIYDRIPSKPVYNDADDVIDIPNTDYKKELKKTMNERSRSFRNEVIKSSAKELGKRALVLGVASVLVTELVQFIKTKNLTKKNICKMCDSFVKTFDKMKDKAESMMNSSLASENYCDTVDITTDDVLDELLEICDDKLLAYEMFIEIYDSVE